MKKIALIPSFEPTKNLINLVKELYKNDYEILVINDGSNKEYDEIFNKVKKYSKILSNDNNMGKGYSLKKGIKYIKDNYKEYIVITMDSDGQHKVEDANKLYNYVLNHNDTLVLGKRVMKGNIPIRSKIGNNITRFVYKSVTKKNIYDTQTGLRAFSNKLTNYMLKQDGNRFDYEMNVLLHLDNIKVKEIEINTIYLKNNKSHFKTFKDSISVYKQIFKRKD